MDTNLYVGGLLLLAATGLLIWDNRGRLGTAKSLMAALVVGAAAVLLPRPHENRNKDTGLVEVALEQNERIAKKLDITIEEVEEAINAPENHGPPDRPSPVTSSRIRKWADRLRSKPR